MCGGGGNAAQDAATAEAQRQSRISTNVSAINSAYAGREPQYVDYTKALQTKYGTELNRQQDIAQRDLKFANAKTGNTGGSVAIDSGTELNREATAGALSSEQQAQGGAAKLRAADEQSRLGMISVAQSGSDIGNAATQTASALKANLENAQADATPQALGDAFANTAKIYKTADDAANLRKGYGSVYGKTAGGF